MKRAVLQTLTVIEQLCNVDNASDLLDFLYTRDIHDDIILSSLGNFR